MHLQPLAKNRRPNSVRSALSRPLGAQRRELPISGRSDPSIDAGLTTQFYILEGLARAKFAFVWDVLKHMLLPACALAFPLAAVIGRVLKNTMMDVMVQDYITLARIKGLSSGVIMDNIRNIDKWPSSPAVSGRQNKMAVLRMQGSVTCGSKTKWPSCACGVASLVAAKQNGRLVHAG